MAFKSLLYIFGGVFVIGVLGLVFYMIAGNGALSLGNQEAPQTVLPKQKQTQETGDVPVVPKPIDSATDPEAEQETASSTESNEVEEQDPVVQPEEEMPPIIPEEPKPQPQIHIVSIEEEGFNPQLITIHVGDTIRWINIGSELHWPASDPHPTHTGLADFDPFADIAPGESFSYIFPNEGAFGYHDHTQAIIDDEATITGVVRVLFVE